jgi:hypothetical protein
MTRPQSVIDFGLMPPPGPLRGLMDLLLGVFGKVVSLSILTLLSDASGHTVTNAATGAGTAVTTTRTTIDFQDAGVDSARLVIRAKNSTLTDLTIQAFNVTTSVAIATATIVTTETTEQTVVGDWTVLKPNGGDEEIEVRVVSANGTDDPILYSVQLHMRTVQARS